MNDRLTVAIALCVALVPAASALHAEGEAVLASVGGKTITQADVDKALAAQDLPAKVGPRDLPRIRKLLLDSLMIRELVHAYVEANAVPCPPDKLDEAQKGIAQAAKAKGKTTEQWMAENGVTEQRIRDTVRMVHLMDQATSEPKANELIQAHPEYFNGTKVQASHILIKCDRLASTADQKAAVGKLETIAADIQAGKTTFAEAAKAHSACPSAAKGGDLGAFLFTRMVPPFAETAFATPVGKTSGVVRTQFGFHLIQVTGGTEGKETPVAQANTFAKNVLKARLENEILAQALATVPIVRTAD